MMNRTPVPPHVTSQDRPAPSAWRCSGNANFDRESPQPARHELVQIEQTLVTAFVPEDADHCHGMPTAERGPTGSYFGHWRRPYVAISIHPSARAWRAGRPKDVPHCNDPASRRHVRRGWGAAERPGEIGPISTDRPVDWRWTHEVAAGPCKRRRGSRVLVDALS
jgi:hypothetical protein